MLGEINYSDRTEGKAQMDTTMTEIERQLLAE